MKMPKPGRGPAPTADVRQNRQRALRNGAYASLLAAALLAALILLNLVIGALPSQYTQYDISTGQMFTLSETTLDLLHSLDSDITAYYLGVTGEEDANITQILDRYAGQSSHFSWQLRDPALYPTFAQQHGVAEADVDSVILVHGEDSFLVGFYDMYEIDYSELYTTGSYSYSFAAENALTSGITRLLRTTTYTVYQLTGHGEKKLESDFTAVLEDNGYTLTDLNLATVGAIPADANLLLINTPTVDYTPENVAMLRTYLQDGGAVLLATDFDGTMPNLEALMAEYGLTRQPGLLIETDSNYYMYGYQPTYLLPKLNTNAVTAGMGNGLYAFLPMGHGILSDDSTGFTYQPLLSTTDSSYAMQGYATAETARQAADDPSGPFDLAVAVADAATDAKVVWIGCGYAFLNSMDQAVAGGNAQLLGSIVNWACDLDGAPVIEARSMSGTTLSVPTTTAIALGLVLVLAVPLAILIGGGVYCILRRRR